MKQYTVVKGDCLSKIAFRHGLKSWREIYLHADNAAFRAKRHNPNRIYPGDVVAIPEPSKVSSRALPIGLIPTITDQDRKEMQDFAAKKTLWAWRRYAIGIEQHLPFMSTIIRRDLAGNLIHDPKLLGYVFGVASIRKPDMTARPDAVAHRGTPVYERDRVQTGDDDSANIEFLSGGKIRMGRDTVVIAYGADYGRTRIDTADVILETGALLGRLWEISGGGKKGSGFHFNIPPVKPGVTYIMGRDQ